MDFKTQEALSMIFTSILIFSYQICSKIQNKLKLVKNSFIACYIGTNQNIKSTWQSPLCLLQDNSLMFCHINKLKTNLSSITQRMAKQVKTLHKIVTTTYGGADDSYPIGIPDIAKDCSKSETITN